MTSSLQYDIIPGYAFNALKLSYVPPVTPTPGFTNHLLSLYFTVNSFHPYTKVCPSLCPFMMHYSSCNYESACIEMAYTLLLV